MIFLIILKCFIYTIFKLINIVSFSVLILKLVISNLNRFFNLIYYSSKQPARSNMVSFMRIHNPGDGADNESDPFFGEDDKSADENDAPTA